MNKNRIAFLIMACLNFTSIGQNPPPPAIVDPPELLAVRGVHLRAIQRDSIPLLSSYLRQLETYKYQFTRKGDLNGATAIENEIKEVTKQLQTANAAISRSGSSLRLLILSAEYGSNKRTADITKGVRKALETGQPTVTLDHGLLPNSVDPAPFQKKETVVTYSINGQRKQKRFPEDYKLEFTKDLD